MALYQQGSKGPMRDLDYINPRPVKATSALPPEVRARLGLNRSSSRNSNHSNQSNNSAMERMDGDQAYKGSANADPKKGKSGAGTDWANPNGHAFVRRGSGIPMSKRASRQSQLTGAGAALISAQSKMERLPDEQVPSRDRSSLPPRPRPNSREASAMAKDCGYANNQVSRRNSEPAAEQGYADARPPMAPVRSQSLPEASEVPDDVPDDDEDF